MAVLDTEESQLRAAAKAKRAAFDLSKIELGYTRITAPIDGMVSERGVRAGQYVHDGTQVISVVPLHNVWVVANYKETQLTRVKIGQRAEITIDTFPGVVVTGRVDSIPASGSQFTLLPPDNATGNFTKVVQRIPVKITLDPGSSARGAVATGHVGGCDDPYRHRPRNPVSAAAPPALIAIRVLPGPSGGALPEAADRRRRRAARGVFVQPQHAPDHFRSRRYPRWHGAGLRRRFLADDGVRRGADGGGAERGLAQHGDRDAAVSAVDEHNLCVDLAFGSVHARL